MARYTGPKDRLSRAEGFDLFGKGVRLTRLNVKPGMHGAKGAYGGNRSQYNKQLREKQKVKRMYGLLEKQFRKYVEKAFKSKENSADILFSELERRLDNVIYRLGFATTRNMARQLVSHRHVLINGEKINIPSYRVNKDDVITLSEKALAMPVVKKLLKEENVILPEWLLKKAVAGKVKRLPKREDVLEEIVEQDIIEFYSR